MDSHTNGAKISAAAWVILSFLCVLSLSFTLISYCRIYLGVLSAFWAFTGEHGPLQEAVKQSNRWFLAVCWLFLKQTRLDCVCEEKHSLKVCFNDIKSCCSTSLWRWVTEDWSLLGGTEEREPRGQDVDVDPNTDLIIGNSSKVNKVNVV